MKEKLDEEMHSLKKIKIENDDDLEEAGLITKPPAENLDIVIEAFEKVKQEYGEIQKIDGFRSWNKAMSSAQKSALNRVNRLYETAKDVPECCFSMASYSKLQIDDKQKQKVVVLPKVESLARKMMWTHTEGNIPGENELHLTHIPFIGDTDEELDFGRYLLPFFPEGIHGVRHGLGDYINDWMLNELYQSLKKRFDKEDDLFEAIYYLFPNKLSPTQLKEQVPDIEARLNGILSPKKKRSNEERIDAYYETMKFLLCSRCSQFDCKKHDPAADWTVDRAFQEKFNENLFKKPCSKDCFKGTTQPPKKRFTPGESLSKYVRERAMDLGGAEKSCLITQIVSTVAIPYGHQGLLPSCSQVHDFLLRNNVPEVQTIETKARTMKQIEEAINKFRNTRYRLKMKVEHKHRISPCDHPGQPCEVDKCLCLRDEGVCTKYCKCDECPHKFPGCLCKGSCQTLACHCFKANIECDPDTCLNCGVDPSCSHNGHSCNNIQLTRSFRKRTEIKLSSIPQAGFGLFLLEAAKKDELISEYTGEIIETDESDRRGKIYDRIHLSYQFGMNEEETCDAFRIGNPIRFANHLKNPNCKTKIVLVNAEHRIGIYAGRDLEAGEELFFDYAYNELEGRKFVDKKNVSGNGKNKVKAS
ncbi:unnamed protein product, partial [Mesorhabditis belari]|uniref:[histone H3]-lysine(27) N-trimethyltransferase n=1 Tax=Mesorhabditis belari TaxID=2138241 RepID=A0AAF3EQW1_9BILA